jgi:predicted nucleotidyltransferase component of viral defense system
MLHYNTVEPETLAILKRLQKIPELKDFALVGGTALSLKYGHRLSIDLDLFSISAINFDKEIIINALRKEFNDDFMPEVTPAKWAVFGFIKNVKVDIVSYPHSIIRNLETTDGLKMFSTEDIIAMKFNAILGRGKKKDFWDIAELLKNFSLKEMLNYHKEKYPEQMLLISMPSALTYFADADESEDPVSLKGQTWSSVKQLISKKVSDFLK